MSIKRVGVEIDLMSLIIAHDKVTIARITTGNIPIPMCFKEHTEFRDILVL